MELEKSLFGNKWRGKRDKFSDPDALKKVLKLYEKAKMQMRLLNPKTQDKIVSSVHRTMMLKSASMYPLVIREEEEEKRHPKN